MQFCPLLRYSGNSVEASSVTSKKLKQPVVQTEELLTKRRDLLEKKIGIELQRAKDASAAKNKRGAPFTAFLVHIHSVGVAITKVHCWEEGLLRGHV